MVRLQRLDIVHSILAGPIMDLGFTPVVNYNLNIDFKIHFAEIRIRAKYFCLENLLSSYTNFGIYIFNLIVISITKFWSLIGF